MTSVGAGTGVGMGVGVGAWLHGALEIVLVSSVTAPLRAKARPDRLAPVARVMLVSARILPANELPAPMVADSPTIQKTLQTPPPLVMTTDELLAVLNPPGIWIIQTAAVLPWASSTSCPVN